MIRYYNQQKNIELTGGWDECKDEFPGQREEVHDVVSAGGHLLLTLLSFLLLVIVCRSAKI